MPRAELPVDASIPGFIGIAAADRDVDVAPDEIDRFAAAYEAVCCDDGAARKAYAAGMFARFVEFRSDEAPSAPVSGGHWAVAAGVLHGVDPATIPDPSTLEGQFALATYDETSQTLLVATDPFALFPLYHAAHDGKHYVSTSALALAKHLALPPDVLSLFVYLRTGYHFGARTHWVGIERLEPADRLVFTPDGVRRDRYWTPEPHEGVTRLDLRAAAAYCTEVCVETFRTLYAGQDPVWADLTGGYDTRLLTLALRQAGARFRVNTVGPEWTEDVRIAQEVAEATQFEWMRFSPPRDWSDRFLALFLRALAAGQGHLDALQLARVLWTHGDKGAVIPHLLSGGGGEHFQYYAWQTEFARAGRSTSVNFDNWVRMRLLGPAIDTSTFADYPEEDVERDLRDRCAAWVRPFGNELNTCQLDRLHAYKGMGHHGAYAGAASSILRSELPFYIRPVFLAAFSTSHRHRNGHRLMRRMIEQLHPRAAAVRTTTGGPAAPIRPTNLHRFFPYYLRLGTKAIEKSTGVRVHQPRAERREPVQADISSAALQFVLGGSSDLRSMRSRALFRQPELERLVFDSRSGNLAGPLFGRILTVEAALRAVGTEVTRNP
jgi:hypothetical protein